MKKTILLIAAFIFSLSSSYSQIKQERTVGSFSRINASDAIKVVVSIGEKESVVYESYEKLMPQLKAEVKNGELLLFLEGSIKTDNNTVAYVTVKQLKGLTAIGASLIEVKTPVTTDKIDLEADGAGCISVEIRAHETDVKVHGAGSIKVKGQSGILNANLDGAGSLKAEDLLTENVDVTVAGAAYAYVNATHSITGSATGAGCVKYNGDPKSTTVKVSSGGSIKKG